MVAVSSELGGALAEIGTRRRVRRGERLLREGGSSGAVLVVLAGSLRVEVTTDSGEDVVLAIRSAGDLLGDLGPLSGRGAGASVVAREDGEIVVVRSDRFLDAVTRTPDYAMQLIGRLADLLNESDQRRVRWSSRSLTARVAHELLLLDRMKASPEQGFATTQAELAGLSGGSRSAVAGVLGDLRDQRLVESGRGRIRVLDPDGLASVAAESG